MRALTPEGSLRESMAVVIQRCETLIANVVWRCELKVSKMYAK